MLSRILITTEDGSHSISMPELNENYHSTHGAIQESKHIFIQNGLLEVAKSKKDISILEMGFGTGLNAFLSIIEAHKNQLTLDYTGIEAYPVEEAIYAHLNYGKMIENGNWNEIFHVLHQAPWDKAFEISPECNCIKSAISLLDFKPDRQYDLVYFDAFAPDVQPELWTQKVFEMLYSNMNHDGILVTYSCKGMVKRNVKAAGFYIEKLPGPPGKREILRAQK